MPGLTDCGSAGRNFVHDEALLNFRERFFF